MMKKCLKCGFERELGDGRPDYSCPKCGVVYKKIEALIREKELIDGNVEISDEEKIASIKQKSAEIEKDKEIASTFKSKRKTHWTVKVFLGLLLMFIGYHSIGYYKFRSEQKNELDDISKQADTLLSEIEASLKETYRTQCEIFFMQNFNTTSSNIHLFDEWKYGNKYVFEMGHKDFDESSYSVRLCVIDPDKEIVSVPSVFNQDQYRLNTSNQK